VFQNLHTHTRFSDGSDEPEMYFKEALQQGLASLGFSDHSPLPFENTFALREENTVPYCNTIASLRDKVTAEKTAGQSADFNIFLGMEIDFIAGSGLPFSYFQENFPLDYVIGSVHLVRNGTPSDLWFIDGPDPATYDEGLKQLFNGDIRKGVTAYYHQINEMLSLNNMDIIGHVDKIKMHNRGRFFAETEAWYAALVDETLDLIRRSGTIVEVNTRGIYKKRSDSLFPGPDILKKIHALDIPVIISSDAHKPAEVAMLFDETAALLRTIGFRKIMKLTTSGWNETPLN